MYDFIFIHLHKIQVRSSSTLIKYAHQRPFREGIFHSSQEFSLDLFISHFLGSRAPSPPDVEIFHLGRPNQQCSVHYSYKVVKFTHQRIGALKQTSQRSSRVEATDSTLFLFGKCRPAGMSTSSWAVGLKQTIN